MTNALAGIRVLDFTHGLAGPFGTQMLAYFGAEVIKVESSSSPDRFRQGGDGSGPGRFNRIFYEFNRNKLDITVNMRTEEGRAIVRRLVGVSDVIAENFSAGVLKRWGMTYEQLKDDHPEIVVLSLPGMGSRGPHRHWVTWGASLLAFSGMTWMWGYPDQKDPVGTQIAHPDYVGGILGAIGVIAALDERRRSGLGQAVELPQVAGAVSLLPTTFATYFATGQAPPRAGNASAPHAPYGLYPCAGEDRWCVIAVTSNLEQVAFQALTGVDPLSEVAISEWTRTKTPHQVMEILQAAGVPAGAVQNGEDMFNDPQLRAREMVIEAEHPRLPKLAYPGIPAKLSATPGIINRHAPDLGQDNDYVFGELLGMGREQRSELEGQGVLA